MHLARRPGYAGAVNWPHACSAVVPCLNEAATIGPLVRGLREHFQDVLIVDDGSTDDTSARATEVGARVLRHPNNRGKGAALQTGLRDLSNRNLSWAMVLDGDGQHEPEEIPRFLTAASTNGADLVIGNRMHACERMPWVRRWTNQWMSARLARLSGVACSDSQCGFRLVRLGAWQQITWGTDRFEVESEMLVSFARAGFRVVEVPVSCKQAGRPSRVAPLRDSLRWIRWWRSVGRSHTATPGSTWAGERPDRPDTKPQTA